MKLILSLFRYSLNPFKPVFDPNRKQLLLAASLVMLSGMVYGWDGPTDNATWTQLTNEMATVKQQLANKMDEAEAMGINTDYAYVSEVVLNRFQIWAQFDRTHPTEIYTAITNQWWARDFKIFPATYNVTLPFEEAQDCIDLGNAAIAELQNQIDGNITLQPPPDLSVGSMVQHADTWYRAGKPTFPSSFTWMPDDADLRKAFGNLGGLWMPLTGLQSDGTVPSSVKNSFVAEMNLQNARGDAPHIFTLGTGLASWMKTAVPAIVEGRREFVQFDIDHPTIRTWYTQYIGGAYPSAIAASGTTPRVHNIANEPHFAMGEKGWAVEYGISEYTKDKYGVWLENKYGTVAALNAAHGSSYTSFAQAGDALPFSTANANPIYWGVPKSLQGGPVWYDVMRFNMDRVNEWFQFLTDTINAIDPGGNGTNIKLTGWSFTDPGRDGGLDVEHLAKMQGVLGSDLNNASGKSVNVRGLDASWQDDYAMLWTEQSLALDFYKSICPDKPFYDSEWHALDNNWKDLDLEPSFVRAAVWLATLNGCPILDTWVWGRKSDGRFDNVNSIFIGEPLTQPKVLDAYGRTIKEINAHAESFVGMYPTNRQFLIYYCEENAIQDLNYMPELTKVYKALKLLNLSVGFTTPSEIGGKTANHVVIVPPTKYILNSSLAALAAFPGHVVLVDPARCFLKTEHGGARGASGIVPDATVALSDEFTMANALAPITAPWKETSPMAVSISNGVGQPAYGVFIWQSKDPETGAVTVALMNVSSQARTVNMTLPPGQPHLRDLITGLACPVSITMSPNDVRLLRADDGSVPPVPETEPIQFIASEGYAAGSLNNHADWSAKNMTVTPSGSGTVAVPGYDNAIYIPGATVVSGRTYTASMDFYFTDASMDPVAQGVQGKPIMNVGFYASNDVNNYGARVNATITRYNLGYSIGLYTNWGDWHAFPVYTSGAGDSGFIASTDFGIDRTVSDTNSALMRLTMELTSLGSTTNWQLTTSLYNLSSATPNVAIKQFDTGGLVFNAGTAVYGGFGGGQSDANARVERRTVDAFLFDFKDPVSTAWELFVAAHNLSGDTGADTDNDGWSDLYEFALNGNPTNPALTGVRPDLIVLPGDSIHFGHPRVAQGNPGITYVAEWSTNLLSGNWEATFEQMTNSPTADPDYDRSEWILQDTGQDAMYFRLRITKP